MRRVVFGLLVVVAALAAVALWLANRSIVVGRAQLGAPRPKFERPVSRIGQPAPNFNGGWKRGRVTVVSVWAPWCKPCMDELPRVEAEIWRRFQPNVDVIGIALGESAKRVADFHQRFTFPLVADPDSTIARRFGANHSIPQTFVIDRSGMIVYHAIGYGPSSFEQLVVAVRRALTS